MVQDVKFKGVFDLVRYSEGRTAVIGVNLSPWRMEFASIKTKSACAD
jgi:hypothetical protein